MNPGSSRDKGVSLSSAERRAAVAACSKSPSAARLRACASSFLACWRIVSTNVRSEPQRGQVACAFNRARHTGQRVAETSLNLRLEVVNQIGKFFDKPLQRVIVV